MKISLKKLKRIFSFLATLVFCCSACNVTNSVRLWVCNMTDSGICLKVNIDSEEYTTYDIEPDGMVAISQIKTQNTDIKEISILDFVSNKNASVEIYLKEEENQRPVKTWRYSESEGSGKQFFNDLFWAKDHKKSFMDPDGSAHDSYIFTITNEDLTQ